ncbi:hypothetical protein [Nonomuraea wenchangensis]|uniref:hypothetical protein n=1 Tax=Nonomuraea wenchangensis TaxID=568860 RepID=UPI003403C98F
MPVEQALEVAEVLFFQDHELGQHGQVERDLPTQRAAVLEQQVVEKPLELPRVPA